MDAWRWSGGPWRNNQVRNSPSVSSQVRYGQCWEDADVLVAALDPGPSHRCLSIASGGENSLALLSRDVKRVLAIDRSPAQIAALELKVAAFHHLSHPQMLRLLGAHPAGCKERQALYGRCRPALSTAAAAFWDGERHWLDCGVLAAARFERYLGLFRRLVLPLVHGPGLRRQALLPRSPQQRQGWYDHHWDGWRWRLLFRLFFNRTALARLGTDADSVRFGEASLAEHLLERVRQVLIDGDPASNPYLHWILQGRFGQQLPLALRAAAFEPIRSRLDRLHWRVQSLQEWLASDPEPIDRFNLSNVLEYVDAPTAATMLAGLARQAPPGARLVLWNRLAERGCALAPGGCWRPLEPLASSLHRRDQVPFYRRLVVAERAGLNPNAPWPEAGGAPELLQVAAAAPAGAASGPGPADAHWELRQGDQVLGRCALWWRSAPAPGCIGLGRIGGLEARDGPAALRLLEHGCGELRRQGCTAVLAPIDGDTWHPYRVRERDLPRGAGQARIPGGSRGIGAVLAGAAEPQPGFAGEPDLCCDWADWLLAAGFSVQARYRSSLCRDLGLRRPGGRPLPFPLESLGSRDPLDLLPAIQQLTLAGFRRQRLFRPLDLDTFRQQGQPWLRLLDGQQSLLAFDGAELVGLLLAHGDRPGGERLVVRTLVVRPGRRWAGLGRALLETCHQRAQEAGHRAVIHALMHDPGPSLALSRHYAQPFRSYVLLSRDLS